MIYIKGLLKHVHRHWREIERDLDYEDLEWGFITHFTLRIMNIALMMKAGWQLKSYFPVLGGLLREERMLLI